MLRVTILSNEFKQLESIFAMKDPLPGSIKTVRNKQFISFFFFFLQTDTH
jgi:hypothetical protein